MTIRVGINGFGRIGRQVLKAIREYYPNDIDVVAFNDLGDLNTMAHLFRYDSNYGVYPGTVEATDGALIVDGDEIKALSERDPAQLPWGELGVEVVIESTGIFTDKASASKHIAAGARKVIISAPAKGEDITIVFGCQPGLVRSGVARRLVERVLYNQLFGAGRQSRQRCFRHTPRFHDDHPQLYQRSADSRPAA